MYLLPLTRAQSQKRREIALEMWDLCCLATPKLQVDLQLVEKTIKYDIDYFEKEIKPLVTDLAIISIFGKQLHDTTGILTLDLKELWDRWLELRNVAAKYLGPEYEGILDIDNKYYSEPWASLICPKLPEFTFHRRPSIQSPPEVMSELAVSRPDSTALPYVRKNIRRLTRNKNSSISHGILYSMFNNELI
jgi:hypothetical protein